MKWTFEQLIFLTALFLLAGCLPKRAFYFFPPNQTFSHQQQGEARKPVAAHSPSAPVLPAQQVPPDGLSCMAATHPEAPVPATFSPVPAAVEANVPPHKAASPGRAMAKTVRLQKAATQKFTRNTEGKRRIHWAAGVSFLLALFGLMTFLISLTLLEPFPLLLVALFGLIGAEITGIIGISKIKKHADRFAGKGLAQTSLVISTVLMLLFFLALVTYAFAFSGGFM